MISRHRLYSAANATLSEAVILSDSMSRLIVALFLENVKKMIDHGSETKTPPNSSTNVEQQQKSKMAASLDIPMILQVDTS